MLRAIKLFMLTDWTVKWMMIEAFFRLGMARIKTKRQFSEIVHTLGQQNQETSYETSPTELPELRKIATAISIMSRYTLWESKCMVRALAAMRMLEKRQIESTLYLGTARDEDGKLIAHAWLRSGSLYISGAEEMHRFTVVRTFAKKLRGVRSKYDVE